MRVRCTTKRRTWADLEAMGLTSYRSLWWNSDSLDVGKEYLVYGLETPAANVANDTDTTPVPSVVVLPDSGYFISVPMTKFEITDPRVSRYWEVYLIEDWAMLLYPPLLHELLHAREYSPGEDGDEEYFKEAEQAVVKLKPLLQSEYE